MDIVTGHVGSAHVTSWQDRDLNQGIFGDGTYILNVGSKMAASIITNNEIHIADGTLVMQGCQGAIQKGTYDSISIDNGSSGMKRNDLICAEYTNVGGVESLGWTVIKGTPAASNPSDPSYTSGDIQNGDTPVQVPVYRVVLNGLTLTSVEPMVAEMGHIESVSSGTVDGTISAGSNTTIIAIPFPAGTYLQTLEVSVNQNLPSLKAVIDVGDYAFTSGEGVYDSGKQKVGLTAFFTLDTTTTVIYTISQTSGSSVTANYRITRKKIG